jgi:DNA-directed RNA polymerase subunit RPC12/RpoP
MTSTQDGTKPRIKMETDLRFTDPVVSVDTTGEVRCLYCNRLLMKGSPNQGSIEIKCPKCKEKIKIAFL